MGVLSKHRPYYYTDDFGKSHCIDLCEHIGGAGGLELLSHEKIFELRLVAQPKTLHVRHLRVRSIEVDKQGRHSYKSIPVQLDSALWTGAMGQRMVILGEEYESVKRVEEKQRGPKKWLAEQAKKENLVK